jgi:peptide/nickel transport system permease protein
MTEATPLDVNKLLSETTALREIGRLERFLGPENYRILMGLLKTPTSILGFILIGMFIFIAVAAPLLAPPVTPNDPYKIPRDGFSPNPQPMGAEWKRNAPPLPFW